MSSRHRCRGHRLGMTCREVEDQVDGLEAELVRLRLEAELVRLRLEVDRLARVAAEAMQTSARLDPRLGGPW